MRKKNLADELCGGSSEGPSVELIFAQIEKDRDPTFTRHVSLTDLI